ncbi:hypothetical protein [Okeania sp. SIO3B5]|uniref:hypothetical protein n=1 Tax=Okeania sp. SIO3B5 TaxID=2607811 RepID=UPI0025E472BC|nr:hypothetical protein [Okeania sp. SIO3B5]
MLEYIYNHPQESESLLGIKYEQLENLLKQAEKLHNNKREIATAKKVRIIAYGGGRPPKLSISEQII